VESDFEALRSPKRMAKTCGEVGLVAAEDVPPVPVPVADVIDHTWIEIGEVVVLGLVGVEKIVPERLFVAPSELAPYLRRCPSPPAHRCSRHPSEDRPAKVSPSATATKPARSRHLQRKRKLPR
jgi:hypothetical protein